MESEDGDSDKENRDPALMRQVEQPTPPSLKRKHKRRKSRTPPHLVATVKHPCTLSEKSFVFAKFVDIWEPGRVIQMTSPFNIVCFRFMKDEIGSASQNKICSFLNYGSKVDFELLDSDEPYRKGMVEAVAAFAEIHRPDLLMQPDRDTMLLDWARFGFIGCKLLTPGRALFSDEHSVLSELVENAADDENRPSSSLGAVEEQQQASRAPLCPSLPTLTEEATPATKRRKLSGRTEDSGYSSPFVPTQPETGCFVLGKLRRFGWWPGRILEPEKGPRPCVEGERLVNWFGDCTHSILPLKDLVGVSCFSKVYQPHRKGLYRVALYDFLSDIAWEVNYTAVHAPDSVNIDEEALGRLLKWAHDGFKPSGPPREWTPGPGYAAPHAGCAGCGEPETTREHPLFVELHLCDECAETHTECSPLKKKDGAGNYCCVCNAGSELLACTECRAAYCQPCLVRFNIPTEDPWSCALCSVCPALTPRCSSEMEEVGAREPHTEETYPALPPPPLPKFRKPLRVLSLFDGIGTGMVALKALGFKVTKYVASEVDSDAIRVVNVRHSEVVQIGDIQQLSFEKIEALGPFDLVIGGSPCNDLASVNPLKKGLYGGSGLLFFEFFRILSYVQRQSSHVFWLFENVVSMSSEDRATISRFLQSSPVVIDAKHFSCMNRSRYFWGNIPDLNRRISPTTSPLTLQECLEIQCGRHARVAKINCVTSRKRTETAPLPVEMEGQQDGLWTTEMERVFGLEPHYTDIGNLSRTSRLKLLGKSWSVHVMRHILSPLHRYFITNTTQ